MYHHKLSHAFVHLQPSIGKEIAIATALGTVSAGYWLYIIGHERYNAKAFWKVYQPDDEE